MEIEDPPVIPVVIQEPSAESVPPVEKQEDEPITDGPEIPEEVE